MYNEVFLIGRATDKPTLSKLDNGQFVGNFTLAVSRPFKNSDGAYDTDFIPVTTWNGLANSANQYINKGSIIGVKGMLYVKNEDVIFKNEAGENKKTIHKLDLWVENIVFIKL